MKTDLRTDLCLEYLEAHQDQSDAEAPVLIFLHGRLANEHDLFDLAPALTSKYRVLSVRAPIRMGLKAYGWFHSRFEPTYGPINAQEFELNHNRLIEFVKQVMEKYKVKSDQIFLLGFSQGAVMSLSLALQGPLKLGGITCMNGCLVPNIQPSPNLNEENSTPIFMSHGQVDDVLPIDWARATKDQLSGLSIDFTYREYPIGHELTDVNFPDARDWLLRF